MFRKDMLIVRLGGDEFVIMGLEAKPGQVAGLLQALDHAPAHPLPPSKPRFGRPCLIVGAALRSDWMT